MFNLSCALFTLILYIFLLFLCQKFNFFFSSLRLSFSAFLLRSQLCSIHSIPYLSLPRFSFFYRVEIYLSPSTKNRGILPFCPFSREKIFCVCFFSALLLFRFCFPSCPSPFFSLFFCVVYEGKIIISPFSFLNFLSNNKS